MKLLKQLTKKKMIVLKILLMPHQLPQLPNPTPKLSQLNKIIY